MSASVCHDTPNGGNHPVATALNIGIADPSRRTPDLPLYTLRNVITGELAQTTDPGRAMVTGKWRDVGKFKGPILRRLAARPPLVEVLRVFVLDADAVVEHDVGDVGGRVGAEHRPAKPLPVKTGQVAAVVDVSV